jgi:DNA-binding NarL/FixJ family response regulator
MIKVVLADDHRLMREGLRAILEGAEDIMVSGEATSEPEVMARVRGGNFDVLLLDLSMPGRSGIELIRRVHANFPAARILVLTMHAEEHFAVRAIRAGAHGYLTKENAVAQVVKAIRVIASGRPFISTRVAEELALHVMAPDVTMLHSQLSDRELQVFTLLVTGSSVSQIAAQLNVSVKTISAHKANILQKMGMKGIAHMVQYAVAQGLLPNPVESLV